MNLSDVKIDTCRGKGPGGQHRNKTDSAVRATHLPTGISVFIDGRKQGQNRKKALKELRRRLAEVASEQRAAGRKADRDHKIHNTPIVRTYHWPRSTVKDHRTGKSAPIAEVVDKGRIDLLR